jgi:hypothetical protein
VTELSVTTKLELESAGPVKLLLAVRPTGYVPNRRKAFEPQATR